MRSIRFSKTFDDQLIDYIDAGVRKYGDRLANDKKAIVYRTIERLAQTPAIKRHDPELGLVVYPISRTPFFVLYDYDDTELRVHFIFIKGKPLGTIDPADAEW
jgi:plasmid stabilization system protein ParE